MRRLLAGATVVLVASVCLLVILDVAYAFSCRPVLIPNGAVNGCSNCHFNEGGGGPRNPFGEDVEIFSSGCGEFWEADLAVLDSDGDGISNGMELGDPSGSWRPGEPQPGDPEGVTNPGVADASPGSSFVRGDANADGKTDISDAVRTLGFLFLGDGPLSCADSGDANDDGGTDISDAVYLLSFLFLGGPPPPAPYPGCGKVQAAVCAEFLPCV